MMSTLLSDSKDGPFLHQKETDGDDFLCKKKFSYIFEGSNLKFHEPWLIQESLGSGTGIEC